MCIIHASNALSKALTWHELIEKEQLESTEENTAQSATQATG